MLNSNSPAGLGPTLSSFDGTALPEPVQTAGKPKFGGALPSHPHSCRTEVLPGPYFLEQLRRERLRAERTKVSLSIAIFRFEGDGQNTAHFRTQRFLAFLKSSVRETDVIGLIEPNSIAALLVDTDEEGRKAYVGKLLDGYDDLPASLISATYPDKIFDGLATDPSEAAEKSPFFMDISDEHYCPEYGLKRALDIVGALFGIVLFSPLMAITAIAIKLSSPGPIIFRQSRLGKNGRPFVFYKFRSMSCNADDRIHREYVASLITGNTQAVNQGSSDAPLYKIQADPRVTQVGRFIRKTSIDELPQFFNVLKGDMSLVGPRPPLPYEVEKYQPWHFRRIYEVKPGITGLWQVEGRSRTSFDDMVRLDLKYIRACSLTLDLKILFKTIKVVLRGIGAA